MPLTLRAPQASKFVPDKFVSEASFSRPPESMLRRVEPQASTVGCPRVAREMGMHKIVGNDFELRSNLLAGESQGSGEYFPDSPSRRNNDSINSRRLG